MLLSQARVLHQAPIEVDLVKPLQEAGSGGGGSGGGSGGSSSGAGPSRPRNMGRCVHHIACM